MEKYMTVKLTNPNPNPNSSPACLMSLPLHFWK